MKQNLLPNKNNLDLKYFKLSEFDSPDEPGSGSKMDKDFLEKLDYARGNAGVPFKINSGFRTIEWNQRVGGRVGSSHLKACAADVHCNNSASREKILCALIKAGFTRIGVGKTFLHCDNDPLKPSAIWLY